jgi:hypothetical protein
MRTVFGHARLVATPAGMALEALGLTVPARLIGTADGSALPDLSAAAGQVIDFSGLLATKEGNMGQIELAVTDLSVPQQTIEHPSFLLAVVSGRMGQPPEPNRKEKPDWFSGAICFANGPSRDSKGSWIRVTSRAYASVTDTFKGVETGAKITVAGFLESWSGEGEKPRCAIALRGFERNAERSFAAATAPSQTLIRSAASVDESAPDIDPHEAF